MIRSFLRVLRPLASLLAFGGALARGHDLTASYATIRLKPTEIELQVKIAADSAWPAIQDTVAPGAIFVREEFETVGRPQLLAFAKIIEEMTVEGKMVAPARIDVAVVDDNFVFTLVYSRPIRSAMRLKESYLSRMAPEYVSNVTVWDGDEKQIASKTLSESDNTIEIPATPPAAATAAAKPFAAGR